MINEFTATYPRSFSLDSARSAQELMPQPDSGGSRAHELRQPFGAQRACILSGVNVTEEKAIILIQGRQLSETKCSGVVFSDDHRTV
jgi:hypothetical protein